MVAFLHAADLHLGMRTTRFEPATAGKIREARFTALDNILKKARELAVDFVLIAGDLFDDSTVDALTARRPFEMLEALPMPVYVLPGNHDPLSVSGVWDRPPWTQRGGRLHLLAEAAPVAIGPGLTLFPCPVLRKTSMDDPTAWIAQAPRANGSIRIGVAHGSLKTRDDLPADDHLITRYAADDFKLDYLALGHWHGRNLYADRAGVERTAYSGVHEPMRYQGTNSTTGWIAYGGADREEFLDSGKGEVLHVRIRAHGEPPQIDPVNVGHFDWREEHRQLASKEDLDRLIDDVANRDKLECKLLKLQLTGVIDAETMLSLKTLREILTHRYLLGEIDETGLHLQPTEDEMRAAAQQGVLRRVLDKLQTETASPEAPVRQIAERAILLLYQIAKG
jgi:DNA repair exonuclease SbcCD nuclease subunit